MKTPNLLVKFIITNKLKQVATTNHSSLIRVLSETTMLEAAAIVEEILKEYQATLKKGLRAEVDSIRLTWY